MTTADISAIRSILISDSDITNKVDSNNIRIGWVKEISDFPSIIITQMGGSSVGYPGYQSAASGNKLRRDEGTVQLDVWSDTSLHEADSIASDVTQAMLSGDKGDIIGVHQTDDRAMYDEDLEVYRKIHRYDYISFKTD